VSGEGLLLLMAQRSRKIGGNPMLKNILVVIKGGGDLATGVAHRLHRAGMQVVVTELAQPTVIRRAVAVASAVYEGRVEIEGLVARLARNDEEIRAALAAGEVPVVIDPRAEVIPRLCPTAVVDAIVAKRNTGTRITDAPIVIGLGPGFTAGVDVHAVIETNRGHNLGRVILSGSAEPDTGIPGPTMGYTVERVLRAPCAGLFKGERRIGDPVQAGERVASVAGQPVVANISGVLRGLLADGLTVRAGMKVGDVDPRGVREHCFTISDKARAIGGGVLEAILYLLRTACWSAE
jgi:xanthine dehydrogenase accessory factor